MQSVRFGLATVVVVALLIVIGVAGWQFGWWLEAKNVDRQVQIDNTQKGTQQAWQDQVLADIRDASLIEPNDPRRGALVDDACNLIPRLTPTYLTSPIEVFASQECA
jgi:hypothetical protein